jgi:acyl-CoA synthetase (AMP-forming)/AMP-acid ligase II
VELREVENVLMQHGNVSQAAVVPVSKSGARYEVRLVAFVNTFEKMTERDLREFVTGRLPSYMVPSAIVFVGDEMPYSENGKIDRLALAERASEKLEREYK